MTSTPFEQLRIATRSQATLERKLYHWRLIALIFAGFTFGISLNHWWI